MRLRLSARAAFVGALLAGGVVPIVWSAAPAAAAPQGGACTLAGTANFNPPGLTATGGSFSYSFTGNLSSCESNVSGAPSSGTVAAGHQYTVTTTGSGWSVTYALPDSTGTGGCAQSTTSGVSVETWSNGTTVVSYTTTGAAADVELQGQVIASTVLDEVSSTGTVPSGTPTTLTVSTTSPSFPVGDSALGQLAFSTSNPQGCASGLTSASINGEVGLGAE